MKWPSSRLIPFVFLAIGSALILLSFQTFFTISKKPVDEVIVKDNSSPVKACIVVLVRNSELDGILSTMTQLEKTYNSKFNYPYVFLNDDDFTEEFSICYKRATHSSSDLHRCRIFTISSSNLSVERGVAPSYGLLSFVTWQDLYLHKFWTPWVVDRMHHASPVQSPGISSSMLWQYIYQSRSLYISSTLRIRAGS